MQSKSSVSHAFQDMKIKKSNKQMKNKSNNRALPMLFGVFGRFRHREAVG
jgi:hypothetical protein